MDVLGKSHNLQLSNFWLRQVKKNWEQLPSSTEKNSDVVFSLCILFGALCALLFRTYGKPNRVGKNAKDGKVNMKKVPVVRGIFPMLHIPIIDSMYNIYQVGKCGLKFFEERVKEYGHCYEMPFGLGSGYFISDPNILQKFTSSTNPNHLNKAKEFQEVFLKDLMENVLFAADTEHWIPHRKILARSFTYKSLQSYLGIMNRNAKRMSKDMVENASITGSVEGEQLAELQFNTAKITAEITMGPDVMTDEELDTFLNAYKFGKDVLVQRAYNPILLLKPVWWLHPTKRKFDKTVTFFREFITNIINKYREKCKTEGQQQMQDVNLEDDDIGMKPFRSMLQEMVHGGMCDQQIVEEIFGMIFAGHETTSVAIHTLMLHLAQYPEYQKMCRDEIDDLLANKGIQPDCDYELTMEDCNGLEVMERCILENLRLTPTLAAFVRRLDEALKIDEDFELEGKGQNVFVVTWCLHRNPEYYPNPEKFDPDRFLPENVKERQEKHPYAYLPFSSGLRMCIGWKLSIIEMKIVMFWILRNFEIHTTDKFEDLTFHIDISIKPHKNINLILKPRTRNRNLEVGNCE